MILNLNELIRELIAVQKEYGDLEIEINSFEGDIPIDRVSVKYIDGKKIVRIESVA